MSKEQPTKNESLFLQLITSYSAGAWVAMGKIKSPLTGAVQKNMKQALFSIDMLEMIQDRFKNSLEEWEAEYLAKSVQDLRMNYTTESEKGEEDSSAPEASANKPLD